MYATEKLTRPGVAYMYVRVSELNHHRFRWWVVIAWYITRHDVTWHIISHMTWHDIITYCITSYAACSAPSQCADQWWHIVNYIPDKKKSIKVVIKILPLICTWKYRLQNVESSAIDRFTWTLRTSSKHRVTISLNQTDAIGGTCHLLC